MAQCYRRVIRIRGADSPNVRLGMGLAVQGKPYDGRLLVPGVLPYRDYLKRRDQWDKIRQCIGLDAEFYEGAALLLYPPDWLNRAESLADELRAAGKVRHAEAIGIDPAEGGDKTAMAAVDRYGLIELVSRQTPNTADITSEALAFMRKHGLATREGASSVVFDRGGGGLQHAHRLNEQGYPVRSIGFGESLALDPKRGLRRIEERLEHIQERYAYVNRRAELYGDLRLFLDPSLGSGFGLPAEYIDLRHQLSLMPLKYDREGRLRLPPKHKQSKDSNEISLVEIIGYSPDEADALVLAIHGMVYEATIPTAGVG